MAEAFKEMVAGLLSLKLSTADAYIRSLSDDARELVVAELFRQYHALCA